MEEQERSMDVDGFCLKVPIQHVFQSRIALTLKQNQYVKIDCFEPQGVFPKYRFSVVDAASSGKIKMKSVAVFIVPQGQEKSWTFATFDGLADLLGQINVSRVIYIYLGRGYIFKDLLGVQEELKTVVLSLLPPNCNTTKVPFMTNGDIGEKSLIYHNNNILVEDVKEGDYYLRQLIFLSNVNQVQSEIRLEIQDQGGEELFSEGSLLKGRVTGNYSFLTFECQRAMILSLAFFPEIVLNKPFKLLILGAGACVLPTFLLKFFNNIEITAVDIDPQVVEIGRRFFGVPQDPRFHVFIEDAILYTKNYTGEAFDHIFLDICIGDPKIQTPPPQFTIPEFTSFLSKNLTEDGILTINMIGNDMQISKIIGEIREVFSNLYKCKCKEDTNQILFCVKKKCEIDWKSVVKGVKELEEAKNWDTTMGLFEYAEWVKEVERQVKPADAILQGRKKNRKKKKRN